MPVKHLKMGIYGSVADEPVARSKTTRKPYVESESITRYRLERDRVIWQKHPESREEIEQHYMDKQQLADYGLIGVKSAPKRQVFTESEDKAKRASRFAEDNIVNAWAKWFKVQYPGIPFMVDKIAQKRTFLGGAILSAANYQKGNPDIFIQSPRGGFAGCYIEQKKSDDIFYTGTRILKPGTYNRHIWQSLYHADLREQGYWVMFSVSLEATQKMTSRYMAGNPYQQQCFEYYCKPCDYACFEFHKHFRPVKDRP